ncbi:MAG: hypothetical protein NZ937_09905 [Armatimonadetes bacterium]|nr:hypothetical protein [Armatimonadota bacterium]
MRKHSPKAKFSKRRLKQLVNDLIAYAKELCPEAEVLGVKIPGYEELDAIAEIVVPDEKYEEVDEAIAHREFEIFMTEGYDIGIRVLSRSDYEGIMAKMKSM